MILEKSTSDHSLKTSTQVIIMGLKWFSAFGFTKYTIVLVYQGLLWFFLVLVFLAIDSTLFHNTTWLLGSCWSVHILMFIKILDINHLVNTEILKNPIPRTRLSQVSSEVIFRGIWMHGIHVYKRSPAEFKQSVAVFCN